MATDNGRSHEPPAGLPVTLMQPTLVAPSFHREGWIYEEKYDGWRLVGDKRDGQMWLLSRTHRDHTRRVPALAAAIAALAPPTLILRRGGHLRCAAHLGDWSGFGSRPPEAVADTHLILAGQRLVVGDDGAAMADDQAVRAAGHLDRLANQRERHGVAIGLEADEVVLGHAPRLAGLEPEARLPRRGDQGLVFPREAIDRPLMGGAVHAHVGDVALPLAQLLQQVLIIDEGPTREEVALEVLHPGFDLALLAGGQLQAMLLIRR
jgi:ATP dependent DNA ligase-like protein